MNLTKLTRRARSRTATTVALALVITGTVSAGQVQAAAPPNDDPQEILDSIENIAADRAEEPAAAVVTSSEGVLATSGGTMVELPADPDQPISAIDPDGQEVNISLPDDLGLGDGEVTADGVTVFEGDDNDVSVTPTEGGGVQTIVTINSAEADTVYEFDLGLPAGAILTPQPDGSIEATDSSGEPLGSFAAPWATDAAGTPVPTQLNVVDGAITQTVDHRSGAYAYPIVVDPWWNPFSWDWSAKKLLERFGWFYMGRMVCAPLALATSPAGGVLCSLTMVGLRYLVDRYKRGR